MLNGFRRALPIIDLATRGRWTLSMEADHAEELHGVHAAEWVRQRIEAAPKGARAHLYKLHDELRRRRPTPFTPSHH